MKRKLAALSAVAVTIVATSPAQAKQHVSLRAYAGPCLAKIIDLEGSGWNPTTKNRYSGAYGLPQALPGSKMSSAGRDWATNPYTQIRWMRSYVARNYGGCWNAYYFWLRHRWY